MRRGDTRTPGDSSALVSPRGLAGRFADGVSSVRVSSTDVRRPASFRSTRSSLMETSGSPSLPDLSGGFASRRQRAPSAPRAVALLSSFFPSLVENPTAGIQDAVTHFEDVPTWDRRMTSSPRVLRKDCRINRSRERQGGSAGHLWGGQSGCLPKHPGPKHLHPKHLHPEHLRPKHLHPKHLI